MKQYTAKELGRILYDETVNVTNLYFQTHPKEKSINKQMWVWLHVGFIAGLKLCGYTDEILDKAVAECQEHLRAHDERYKKAK